MAHEELTACKNLEPGKSDFLKILVNEESYLIVDYEPRTYDYDIKNAQYYTPELSKVNCYALVALEPGVEKQTLSDQIMILGVWPIIGIVIACIVIIVLLVLCVFWQKMSYIYLYSFYMIYFQLLPWSYLYY